VKKLVFFTGAGISQESGLQTFRGAGGLWEGRDVSEVASIEGWHRNPQLVLDFYNQRRKQLLDSKPNQAHHFIASLENVFDIEVITQNVDDLHERAGSSSVLHLHGELLKCRSVDNDDRIYSCLDDIHLGDVDSFGAQLRPHIVWFGEMVPMLENAIPIIQSAEIIVVVGTSLQVYPAAGLLQYAARAEKIYYIDPFPNLSNLPDQLIVRLKCLQQPATEGMKQLYDQLLEIAVK